MFAMSAALLTISGLSSLPLPGDALTHLLLRVDCYPMLHLSISSPCRVLYSFLPTQDLPESKKLLTQNWLALLMAMRERLRKEAANSGDSSMDNIQDLQSFNDPVADAGSSWAERVHTRAVPRRQLGENSKDTQPGKARTAVSLHEIGLVFKWFWLSGVISGGAVRLPGHR